MTHSLRRRSILLGGTTLATLTAIGTIPVLHAQEATRRPDVVYVPTPQDVVDAMLKLARVDKNDVLYDLGCGDGRIVVTAAVRHGARGIGVDIDPERIRDATANVERAGVGNRVKIVQGDLFAMDFKDATVVSLYLLPSLNLKLRPKLWADLRPGTRIVSHDFDMGDWAPQEKQQVNNRTIFLWTIAERKRG